MATLFVPREIVPGETRVATNPDTVKRLVKEGHTVTVEAGAGDGAFIPDQAFRDAGAAVTPETASGWGGADVVLKLHPPRMNEKAGKHEAEMPREGAILVSFLWPLENLDTVKILARRKVTAFAMDQMPRITRAQSIDALSSQANLAGYKAVVMAAERLPKIFPLMMTPSGTITPSRVVIMGAGVAGLQAIATAKRMGAVVEVSDVRAAVKEQVESLGGRFIEVPVEENMETAGGYAKEASEDFLRKQREIVRKHVVEGDVVITTALVPGKPAPRLISADMVKEMRPGSVIVDLAAERGGNCELTEPGKTVTVNGVTVMGTLNIPGTVPFHASDMYAKNLHYVMQHLFPKGQLNLDLADEINAACVVTHGGEVRVPAVADRLKGGD
jgi:proton-translocating NAD(P)+ transhydrogenase subunit alpha